MKHIFRGLMCVVVASMLAFNSAEAQDDWHQLTQNDFEGRPHANAEGVIAYTNCTIDFEYQAQKANGYFLLNFTIKAILNKDQSWLDKAKIKSHEELAEVLKHEQGHYNIAYLEQQELLREVGKTVFYANYRAQAHEIFNRIDAKYKQLNLDYDEDTQHMVNRGQQHSWNAYFDKRLAYMPPVGKDKD